MKILHVKKHSQTLKDFAIREWKVADFEHYGETPDWHAKRHIFQASDKNEIVGYADCEIILNVLEVKQILIVSTKRRQRIGKTLMQKVEEFAKNNNVHKIYIVTGKGWESEKFYTALGYKKEGDLPKHFLKRDFLHYSKYL